MNYIHPNPLYIVAYAPICWVQIHKSDNSNKIDSDRNQGSNNIQLGIYRCSGCRRGKELEVFEMMMMGSAQPQTAGFGVG